MYHLVDWIYILLDGLVCSIGGYFNESRCISVADWSEMKTCQTSLLGKSICSSFCRRFQTFVRKTEMEWQITETLMIVIGYVKQTASRKTEQSKLRWKDENQSSLNSRSFKELLVNKRLHLRRVILTKRERRMSTMSSFLTFFSSSAGIVFFLLSRIFTITISITETSGLFSSSLLYL